MSEKTLVLASESAYKRRLLERLGLDFEAVSTGIDESAREEESPGQTALRLARAKAAAAETPAPATWTIGADQVIALGNRRFTKPGTRDAAIEQLTTLAGRTHSLLTGVAVRSPSCQMCAELVEFEMEMRSLRSDDIVSYVDADEPFDCAGSYKIEAGGIRLFRRLRGDDYTAIIGLPLTRVWELLEQTDFIDRTRQGREPATTS